MENDRDPLYPSATHTLNRQIKSGIDDHQVADLVLRLREDGRLYVFSDEDQAREPRLICSMGLAGTAAD